MNQNKEEIDAATALEILPFISAVVEDGTWVERFASRLLDPVTAAEAGKEAILDYEVIDRIGILEALWRHNAPVEAIAAVLREIWLGSGINADPEDLADVFKIARNAKHVLMNSDEVTSFDNLPENIFVFRGQIYSDGNRKGTGSSWTLSEEVAEWYAAPVLAINQPHGWFLQMEVPKSAILALFLSRGEQEVILDMTILHSTPVIARRGTCDSFPEHLTY